MILFYILIIAHSILSALFNFEIIAGENWHVSQAASLAPLFGLLFCYKIPWRWQDCIYLIFIALAVRWIVFDLFLNLFLGQHWLYVGSGTIDLLIGDWQYILKLISIFFIIVFTIMFYKTVKK